MNKWKHVKTGGIYRILGAALIEADMKVHILYSPHDSEWPVWSRPITEFMDGRFIPVDDEPDLFEKKEVKA